MVAVAPQQPGSLRPGLAGQLAGARRCRPTTRGDTRAQGSGPALHLGAGPAELQAHVGQRARRLRLLLGDAPGRRVRLAFQLAHGPDSQGTVAGNRMSQSQMRAGVFLGAAAGRATAAVGAGIGFRGGPRRRQPPGGRAASSITCRRRVRLPRRRPRCPDGVEPARRTLRLVAGASGLDRRRAAALPHRRGQAGDRRDPSPAT